jgi:hypothetical protein
MRIGSTIKYFAEMSGLECLTKYNNIPTPVFGGKYIVSFLRTHNNSLWSTRSPKLSVGLMYWEKESSRFLISFGWKI